MIKPFTDTISGLSAWVGPDIAEDPSWIAILDDRSLAEIDTALRHVEERGLTIPFAAADFPLDTAADFIDEIPRILEDEQGFLLVRGIDRSKYTVSQC
ncbi:MAG TPA: hypothetical protein VIW46_12340, partial [Acidimicrobiia bacterium]